MKHEKCVDAKCPKKKRAERYSKRRVVDAFFYWGGKKSADNALAVFRVRGGRGALRLMRVGWLLNEFKREFVLLVRYVFNL